MFYRCRFFLFPCLLSFSCSVKLSVISKTMFIVTISLLVPSTLLFLCKYAGIHAGHGFNIFNLLILDLFTCCTDIC